ncbi:EndoU domain-containing protein [Corynebacterium lactis]|nr:EndoU domain-containing protein [Corynebacterium lactis]
MDVDAWLATKANLIAPAMAKAQAQNLSLVDKTMGMSLTATGYHDSPIGLIVPEAFTGYMPDGRELGFIKHAVANRVRERMALGASQAEAWKAGSKLLATIVQTGLIDTQRMAKAVAGLARPRTLYVRMANVPCCPRCAILAGKKGYWSKPFLRHPGCDCTQIPLAEGKDVELSGPHFDVDAYFKSLSEAEQDKYFTKAGAEALRNGADYVEVVNSMQGLTGVGDDVKPFTRYGAPRSGWRRLSVPEIMRRADGDVDRMRELLLQYRYIRPERRYGPVSRVDFSKGWPHDSDNLGELAQELPKNDPRPVPSSKDWAHILDGEPIVPGKKIQGGHRHGTGRERKTEFPRWWSDDDIKKAVLLTIEAPHASKVFGTTRVLYRVVDEVLVQVSYYPDPDSSGSMILGASYPKNGSGVVKNIGGRAVEQPLDVSLVPRE